MSLPTAKVIPFRQVPRAQTPPRSVMERVQAAGVLFLDPHERQARLTAAGLQLAGVVAIETVTQRGEPVRLSDAEALADAVPTRWKLTLPEGWGGEIIDIEGFAPALA